MLLGKNIAVFGVVKIRKNLISNHQISKFKIPVEYAKI
jgi:hypothetical protein